MQKSILYYQRIADEVRAEKEYLNSREYKMKLIRQELDGLFEKASRQGKREIDFEVFEPIFRIMFFKDQPKYDRVALHLVFMDLEREGYTISDFERKSNSYKISW